MNSTPRLRATEVARLLGINVYTWYSYVNRAEYARAAGTGRPYDAPAPDGHDGGRPWWWESTITAWQRTRPGTGRGDRMR